MGVFLELGFSVGAYEYAKNRDFYMSIQKTEVSRGREELFHVEQFV